VVLGGINRSRERFGKTLHLWNPKEGEIRSFGETPDPVLRPSQLVRRIWPSSGGGIWSVPKLQYRIEEWSLSGDHIRTFIREVEWFPETSKSFSGNPREPPWPRIKTLKQDSEGLLWVVAWVPSGYWEEAWKDTRIIGTHVAGGSPSYNQLFSSRIEVIDPTNGQVISSRSWRGLPLSFGPDGLLATTYQDLSGYIFVDLWRAQLVNPPEGGGQ
jgi:hypothetical protein